VRLRKAKARADSKVVATKVTVRITQASPAQVVAAKADSRVAVKAVRVRVDRVRVRANQGRTKMPPGLLPLLTTQSRTISKFRSRSRLRWLSSAVVVVATRTTGRSTVVISAPA
jgi:hypothetical protein